MPKALRPGGRFPIVLDEDMDLPKEERPTFYVQAVSCGRQIELSSQWEELKSADLDTAERYRKTLDALWGLLVGWENMGDFAFERKALDDLLNITEATELLAAAIWNNHLAIEEKKSSKLPA